MAEARPADVLSDLLATECAIVRAYDAALDVAHETSLRGRLRSLRDAHRQHVSRLSRAVHDVGAPTPDAGHDVAQSAGAIRNAGDLEQLIQALRLNEADLAEAYSQSLETYELPAPERAMLREFLEVERRHESEIGGLLGGGRDAPGVERSGPGDTGHRR